MSSEMPKNHVSGPKEGDLRLSNASLDRLPGHIRRPGYDRASVTPGIVHLGIGAFHRAHQAVVIDDLLARWRDGLGNHRRQPAKCGHAGCPRPAGLPLHGCRSLRRRHRAPDHRLGARMRSRQRESRRLDRAHGRSGHAHRLADGHREGLLPHAANRRTRRASSRYRSRPAESGRAAIGHRVSRGRTGAPAGCRRRRPSPFCPATISRPTAIP